MIRYIKTSSVYGKLLLLIGLLIAVPILILPFYHEEIEYLPSFFLPSLLISGLGIIVCIILPNQDKRVTIWQSSLQKGSLPVLFAWISAFFAGAAPFIAGGQMKPLHAVFESVSGWTTTGLSLADVGNMPRIFLFHRSFMQYCGGLGFLIVIVMLVHGKQSMALYQAEGHQDRIMPSLKRTARAIFLVYNSFLIAGTALYCIFGMPLFDAVCHMMSSLSTAGYSTLAGSIGEYNSLPIELITIAAMLIGATNFAILLLLVRRRIKEAFRISELRFMFGLVIVFTLLCAFFLVVQRDMGIFKSLRDALFGVVSVFSTTGFATADYALWPQGAVGLLILLMLVGGGAGSTAGGIKLSRTYLLLRITKENIRRKLSPDCKVTAPSYGAAHGPASIDPPLIADTFGFIACYMGVLLIGTLFITLTAGCSVMDALFEFASAFGNIGISNGLTNVHTDSWTLIIEIIGMMLGRLEIFIVFIALYTMIQGAKGKGKKLFRR